ncbi:uncharacterized protein LOC144449784 [Glandiceps talaboti]
MTVSQEVSEQTSLPSRIRKRLSCEEEGNQYCETTGKCVPSQYVCDGVNDCNSGWYLVDNSDEPDSCNRCDEHVQYECSNRNCVAIEKHCNGLNDCGDWSDEKNCNTQDDGWNDYCYGALFTCSNGYDCVPTQWVCDGIIDCPDKRDELYGCDTFGIGSLKFPATHAIFDCRENEDRPVWNDIYIQFDRMCDGISNCDSSGGSDENCEKVVPKCSDGEYRCSDGQCIPIDNLCDGALDCSDDEHFGCNMIHYGRYCPNYYWLQSVFFCKNGQCLPSAVECDGDIDCADGSDEHVFCQIGSYNIYSFTGQCTGVNCADGVGCVDFSHVCDGVNHCSDGSDEDYYVCLAPWFYSNYEVDDWFVGLEWTEWYNIDHPKKGKDKFGDSEDLETLKKRHPEVCSPNFGIQCAVADTGETWLATDQKLEVPCTMDGGLVCKNIDQDKACLDYKIRLRCPAKPSHWTKWYDRDTPGTGAGGSDWENLLSYEFDEGWKYPDLCENPIGIECRVKKTHNPSWYTGQYLYYPCTVKEGLICRNMDQPFYEQCEDYEVRFQCPSEESKKISKRDISNEDEEHNYVNNKREDEDNKNVIDNNHYVSRSSNNNVITFNCTNGFLCDGDTRCIRQTSTCDSYQHCHDNTDEENCKRLESGVTLTKAFCGSQNFECINGDCIPAEYECDWFADCYDKSDEHKGCYLNGFECDEGYTYIPQEWVCDNIGDCIDGEDESIATCGIKCDGFLCDNNQTCVANEHVCDGQLHDCTDKTDETLDTCRDHFNCFQCGEPANKCLSWDWVCDSVADCDDVSEETLVACGRAIDRCWEGAFMCLHARFCVPQIWRCDGDNDCGDISDEQLCDEESSWGQESTWSFWGEWSECSAECGGERSRHRACLDAFGKCTGDSSECESCVDDCKEASGHRCGTRKHPGTSRIVGGEDAPKGSWPWQAQLVFKANANNEIAACGGTLIGKKYVVSAAHCFIGSMLDASRWVVRLGRETLDAEEKGVRHISVKKILVHKKFDQLSMDNDIAVLVLKKQVKEPTEFINFACLDGNIVFNKKSECFVTGWGLTDMNGYQPTILQEAYVPLIPIDVCNKPLSYNGMLTDNMLCAGHMQGDIDACQGDSGGPLVCKNKENGRWYLTGVVSWGYGCALKNKPGIYTKVNNYISWLENETGQTFHQD